MEIEPIGTNKAVPEATSYESGVTDGGKKSYLSFFMPTSANSEQDVGLKVEPKPQKPQEPKAPSLPDFAGQKTFWVPKGWTIKALAEKYNVSESEIIALNPKIKTADDDIVGKRITVPYRTTEDIEEYQRQLGQYDADMKAYDESVRIYQKSLEAQAVVDKIKATGYSYESSGVELSVDYTTGYIVIKAKKDVTFGAIRNNFGITGGKIREMNPGFEEKYAPVKHVVLHRSGLRMENDWDMAMMKAGDTVIIDAEYVNPEMAHRMG